MAYQKCISYGDGFGGEDEDKQCDNCMVDMIEKCEKETGHSKTAIFQDERICKRRGIQL